MGTLSLDRDRCRASYDAVVVGSGYGGGVTACRLARAGWSVCVLERGHELRPGDYPTSTREAVRHIQAHTRRLDLGRPTALFDFRVGRGMGALVGCGLGGTSLINANVMLEPAPSTFDDERWPTALRTTSALTAAFASARAMLGAERLPPPTVHPTKLSALEHVGAGLGLRMRNTPVAVTFGEGEAAAAGVRTGQPPCTQCGNCVSGCNEGAKNTVLMNYLPDAVAHGAEVFTGLRVERVGPGDRRRWRVHARRTDPGGAAPADRADPADLAIDADVVVLAAGTLGSTEILTRSTLAGLPVSRQVGRRFSGNGDFLGVAYDGDRDVRAMGWRGGGAAPPIGPCISGSIEAPGDTPDRDAIVQDGVVPAPLVPFLPAAMLASAAAFGRDPVSASRWLRRLAGLVDGPYAGVTARSLVFLLMTNDEHDGTLTLERGRLAITWPGPGERPSGRRARELLTVAAEKGLGASYLDPPWLRLGRSLMTVHPLGGCVMADRAEDGVVDDAGRVFTGAEGSSVHAGLHVLDGAVVPRPLGVNPGLTIAALAERASEAIVADGHAGERGRAPAHRTRTGGGTRTVAGAGRAPAPAGPRPESPALPVLPPPAGTPGIRWNERLAASIDWRRDGTARTDLELVLGIEIDDLAALRADITTPGRITGRVRLPAVDAEPLPVVCGVFQMFLTDESRVDTRRMTYRLDVRTPGGETLRIDGHKVMHDDAGFDAWTDLTSMAVTVSQPDGEVIGAGTLRIDVPGVAGLARSITAVRAPSEREAARLRLDFLRLFLGQVTLRYGKALATAAEFRIPPPAAGPHRLLPAPETWWFVDGHRWVEGGPDDGYASLKLTRYRGGSRGPVILAPGFAMAARSFAIETTEQNLTEHLFQAGYDVWLFDYRASIDLPSARLSRFTLDDVVRQDWPTAVDQVLRLTGAASVQVVGHCMGSTTALMAVASGLAGVRSVVCSQNTLHIHMLPFSRFKARSGIAHLLQGAGFEHITSPRLGQPPTPVAAGLDLLYRLNPLRRGERCSSPVCRWAFTYFGPTHRHERLDEDTHQALRGHFGPGSLDALAHIAAMARRGEAVTVDGRPYFDADRLRLPILFLAGEHNRIFLPSGARRTYALLRQANPEVPYEFELLKRYAHLDGLIGRSSHRDVFPLIRRFLDRHSPDQAVAGNSSAARSA